MPLTSFTSALSGRTARLLKFGWRRRRVRGGCFFPPEEASPPAFAASIVQGKGYDLSRELASGYFGALIQRMLGHTVEVDLAGLWNRQGPVLGRSAAGSQRLGRQAFKAGVPMAYRKLHALHCAGTEWAGGGRCDPN
jgi:hypothetical protein